MRTSSAPALRPGTPVVHRGSGNIQVGCAPERGVVIKAPADVGAHDFAALLRMLSTPHTPLQASRAARRIGMSDLDLADIFFHLDQADLMIPADATSMRIRVHGNGPVAHRLSTLLRDNGHIVATSVQRPRGSQGATDAPTPWHEQLVVLCDFLTHDPAIITALMTQRIAHLPAFIRDGTGMVGPLVLPGQTSCLRCADHHRADIDPQWPLIANQLIGQCSHASRATIVATAALAAEQVDQIAAGLADESSPSPQTLDRTVEWCSNPARLRTRQWTPHPLCGCTEIDA